MNAHAVMLAQVIDGRAFDKPRTKFTCVAVAAVGMVAGHVADTVLPMIEDDSPSGA